MSGDLTLAKVRQTVSTFYRVSVNEILSPSRRRETMEARSVGIYLAREHTPHALETIGRRFGRCGHTSALVAIDRVKNRLHDDDDFRARLEAVEALMMKPPAEAVAYDGPPIEPFEQQSPAMTLRRAVADVLAAMDDINNRGGAEARRRRDEALHELRFTYEATARGDAR
ncbi:helix-turn-helix domain-containing protein [Methylopila sp. 73B]|uniref:helix-turn-helix domain-containing protein n=1 Tax=Methylopila sp. 73B TaxID=1120792 RepID=UPI00037BC294|nr:helix-turn-helix domain-containing protein [Methylopila sp. 73B]